MDERSQRKPESSDQRPETRREGETLDTAMLEPSARPSNLLTTKLKVNWQILLRLKVDGLNFELVVEPSLYMFLIEHSRLLQGVLLEVVATVEPLRT